MAFANWTSNYAGNTFADLLTGQISGEYNEQTKNALHNIAWNRWELFAQDTWKMSPSFTLNYGARLSVFEPWTDREGNGVAVFDQSRYASDLAAGVQFPGVSWNARDPNTPCPGRRHSVLRPAPRRLRVGRARKRRDRAPRRRRHVHLPRRPAALRLAGRHQRGRRSYYQGNGGFTIKSLEGSAGGNVVFDGNTLDINDNTQPATYNWSLTLNQKLPWSMNLEIGYVGNKKDHLMNDGVSNYNAVPLGAMLNDPNGNDQLLPPALRNYGDLNVFRHSMLPELPRHPDAAGAAAGQPQLHARLHLLEGARRSVGDSDGTRPSGLRVHHGPPYRDYNYGVLGYDRTHVATGAFSWMLRQPEDRRRR